MIWYEVTVKQFFFVLIKSFESQRILELLSLCSSMNFQWQLKIQCQVQKRTEVSTVSKTVRCSLAMHCSIQSTNCWDVIEFQMYNIFVLCTLFLCFPLFLRCMIFLFFALFFLMYFCAFAVFFLRCIIFLCFALFYDVFTREYFIWRRKWAKELSNTQDAPLKNERHIISLICLLLKCIFLGSLLENEMKDGRM